MPHLRRESRRALPDKGRTSFQGIDHRAGWRDQIRQLGGRTPRGRIAFEPPMSRPNSYEDVAAALGIKLCPGCDAIAPAPGRGRHNSHVTGWAHLNTIHWKPRRLAKPGLRHFLGLVASQRLHNWRDFSPAEKLWAANWWAGRQARELFRVRFPFSYSENDRANARWRIANGDKVPPAARRWANERGKSHD